MLKTEIVQSNEVTPRSHLSSSERLIGGEKEKVCNCLFILNSKVSCGRVLFVESTYQYAFLNQK